MSVRRYRPYVRKPVDLGPLPQDPTPEEIRAGCEAIRAGWSAAELRRRSRWAQSERVEVEFVGAEEIGLDPGFGG